MWVRFRFSPWSLQWADGTCWGVCGTKLRRCTTWRSWDTWSSRDHQLVSWTTNRHDWTPPCCVVIDESWLAKLQTWWMSSARSATSVRLRPRRLELASDKWRSWIISSLWCKTWPAQPNQRSRASWANDMGTEQRGRTTSFDTWSCHLTSKIVRRQRIWNTFSLSHTARDSVHLSQPCNTVGMISVWKSFTHCSQVWQCCRIFLTTTWRCHDHETALCQCQPCLSVAKLAPHSGIPSVIQKDFSGPYYNQSEHHWKRWGRQKVLSYSQQVYRRHQHARVIWPVYHLCTCLLGVTWACCHYGGPCSHLQRYGNC